MVKIQSMVSEEKVCKEKVYGCTHTRTWLSLYKSIINRIIQEISIHKFVDALCILAMRLHKAPKGSNLD